MTKFVVGDQVRVYDGDVRAWVLGTVETVTDEGITVRTELLLGGLPLVLGIPPQALEMLVRAHDPLEELA